MAKMLANRIHKLSEEKFAELSGQMLGLSNVDSLKKVCPYVCVALYTDQSCSGIIVILSFLQD